ncbi:MAG: restriction endonuclease subunit S, partial [Spirochaetales bacterium]
EKFGRDISGEQYKNYIVLNYGEFSYNKGNSKKYPQGCIYKLVEFKKVAVPNAFISFRINDEYISDFLKQYFEVNYHGEQLKKFISSGARSDGLLNINPHDFFTISFPSPKKSEQQKIADCFSSLDELIAVQIKKLESFKAYKKGLIQGLFPAEGESAPRLRFPESQGEQGWEEKQLDAVCKFQDGYAFSSTDFVDSGKNKMQVIRITDINNRNENFEKAYVPTSLIERLDLGKYLIKEGDLLLSLTGAAGFNFFVWNCESALINQRTMRIIIKDKQNEALKILLEAMISTKINIHGTGQNNNLSKETLKNVIFRMPGPKEQQKIAGCLSSLDDLITAQTRKIEALKTHKKGLMQQLFPQATENI